MSVVLGYVPQEQMSGRIWLETPGEHHLATDRKDELLAAMLELKPRGGSRLFVLGAEVGALPEPERRALLGRVGFVPADGGLMSSLNAWENLSLPVAYHSPARVAGLFAEARPLLEELGGVDDAMLAKLPEDMTLYEKRLAAFVRALLQNPELLVTENLAAGLGPTKQKRVARFGQVYRRRCPGGTLVQIDE
jgi:ABC-type transporter Mla maintaining outer membrane lipid asymmetry ATPase subunit MlaF